MMNFESSESSLKVTLRVVEPTLRVEVPLQPLRTPFKGLISKQKPSLCRSSIVKHRCLRKHLCSFGY